MTRSLSQPCHVCQCITFTIPSSVSVHRLCCPVFYASVSRSLPCHLYYSLHHHLLLCITFMSMSFVSLYHTHYPVTYGTVHISLITPLSFSQCVSSTTQSHVSLYITLAALSFVSLCITFSIPSSITVYHFYPVIFETMCYCFR